MFRERGVRGSTMIVAAAIVFSGFGAATASAAVVPTVFVGSGPGVPCTVQPSGVQFCEGSVTTRVPSWDGVPLDVNLTLPPPAVDGPYPLIVHMHGYGLSKSGVSTELGQAGYAVLDYTARGFGQSCGSLPSRIADPTGCAKGWIHLADVRYEVRDTQTLAGYLADEGIIQPKKIGVTGESYGGGQSMMLATLKDRVMLPNGTLVAWQSPGGKPMEIAAAAPIIPWADLAYALVPNGRKLDYDPTTAYGSRVGIAKQSYLDFLYTVGNAQGYYAPPGVDPESDITTWFARIQTGEPYDSDPTATDILNKIRRFHSAFYLEDPLTPSQREAPAPLLIYNAWTDDLFPADESIDYANKIEARHPRAEVSLFYANTGGHPRASLTVLLGGGIPVFKDRVLDFWARHLKGAPGQPFGVETFTQNCDGAAEGPFITPTWEAQHPGEVRFSSDAAQSVTATGGDPATGAAVDPFAGTLMAGCFVAQPALDQPGVASYRLPAATGAGYTLLGSPTVIAQIAASDPSGQVAARLWDVAPDGTEKFVTRAVYRPDVGSDALQVFQLHSNGWHFEGGHVAKLELLARDTPYARASNSAAGYTVRNLQLRLPVHEKPDGNSIRDPLRPDFPGRPAPPCTKVLRGTARGERLVGTVGGDRILARGGPDRINARGGADCVHGQAGNDTINGAAGNDHISGEAGADHIAGGFGNDIIRGGGGKDRLYGGIGRDVIFSRDGRRDIVNCGRGRDRVRADRRDRLVGCEIVSPRRLG